MANSTIALAFFGITRSLKHTIESIQNHIITPASECGGVKIYCHFFDQESIDNPRTGERGRLDRYEYQLLRPDWLQLEAPGASLERWKFENLKGYGDYWDDNFASMRNLVHQLDSLHCVTKAVLEAGHETCIFARPDLTYHDSIGPDLADVRTANETLVRVPSWQAWHGLNDRFAICNHQAAIDAYGSRIASALEYCSSGQRPLHSERLLSFSLDRAGIPTDTMDIRASRVRFDGSLKDEGFWPPPPPGFLHRQATGVRRAMKRRFGF